MSASPIVCPFCPLHCDDVVVAPDGSVGVDCERAAEGFAAAFGAFPGRVGEAACSLDQARQRAAALLRARGRSEAAAGRETAPAVTVVTAGTDLVSAKSLESLRAAGRIDLAVDASPAQRAMLDSVRRDGLLSATQSAVRHHADLLWSIGDVSALPRIWQRLIDPQRPAEPFAMPGGVTAEALAAITDAVHCGDSSLLSDHHRRLCESLWSCEYVAVVLGTGAWPPRESTAAAVMLSRLVMQLGADRRAVLLSFDAAATNRVVTGWRTNRMLTASGASGGSDERSAAVRLGDAAGTDAAPAAIQIGGRDPGAAQAEVYLPAAVVGVHRAGAVVRGDGSVTLPLERIAESELPTPTEQLESLVLED